MFRYLVVLTALMPAAFNAAVFAAGGGTDSNEELAKKLQNPVAPLINVPLQNNYNWDVGPEHDGNVYMMRFQPVIPLPFNKDYAVVSRSILPYISQKNIAGRTSQSGIGDLEQSFFFTPMHPSEDGLKWGAGPILYLPTASDTALGAEKWGLGPTGVLLKQSGPWTAGFLANQVWSVAGNKGRAEICQTYMKPFGAYTFPDGLTINATVEGNYDWRAVKWSLPLVGGVSKMLTAGGQKLNLGAMLSYDPEMLAGNKLGLRFVLTFLFPVPVNKQ